MSSDPSDAAASGLAHQYARLLALAAHELRTPASVVGGYLRMLQRDGDPPLSQRQRKMVDEAARSCARLVDLIAEVSDLGKLEGGTFPLQPEPLDLLALLTEVASTVHEGEDRGVRLVLTGTSEDAPILGDRSKLGAAFATFFRAVLREQVADSAVVVDRRITLADGQRLAIVVVAADADVARARSSRPSPLDETRGGLGLALPLARRIVERHGGRASSPTPASPDDRGLKSALIVSLPLRG